jgi:hypothetical protein
MGEAVMPGTYQEVKEREFLAHLGEVIVKWNHLEANTQVLLTAIVGGGDRISILTANLGNVALKEAITTFANEFASDEFKPHVLHYAEFFDRLREYRNWFTHSILAIGRTESGEAMGLSQTISAKRRLTLHQKPTGLAELSEFLDWLDTAHRFASELLCVVYEMPGTKPLDSVTKPDLPDRLQRPRLYLRDVEPITNGAHVHK